MNGHQRSRREPAEHNESHGTDAIAHHREFGNLSELLRANKGNHYRSDPVRVQSDAVQVLAPRRTRCRT
jgi:hypothetical protein